MKQLSGAVCDLASEVVSVLREGDHRAVAGAATGAGGEDQAVGVAAVRVLGADVLLPSTIFRRRPDELDLALVREAVRTFPPGADASVSTVWSHWAMEQTLRRLDQPAADDAPPETVRESGERGSAYDGEPDAAWLDQVSWQQLTHQLAVLGALAVPVAAASAPAVTRAAARRPVDLARGFVRAVRRRDWLQAAGAGRWLAVVDAHLARNDSVVAGARQRVPSTLGLDSGLEFVLQMGGRDPRVMLHAHAAQLMRHSAAGEADARDVASVPRVAG